MEQRHAQAFGQPEAVADAVALLVSHDARWITGPPPTRLHATGGPHLGPEGFRPHAQP
ncbi:hypothetical protein ACGFMO_26175 [Streptomyces niveus]|uniref:hypothetical protein n=1 Tax=Streptomyces niveus TaxID=193462 RepID=UPI0037192D88